MVRDAERQSRAQEGPIVGSLPPDAPGISAAIRLTPNLGIHLRGLADELLVNEFRGATITRGEREMLATAVSAANDCFFCMDSHAAHATAVLELTGTPDVVPLVEGLKTGVSDGLSEKMQALITISRIVGRNSLELTSDDVAAAKAAGASDADIQLAVLIAAGFSMYNRMVDGFRAPTPPSTEVYAERAAQIAQSGYSAPPPVGATPRQAGDDRDEGRPA
jgi:uncharacterized peroxidase-related enzyme